MTATQSSRGFRIALIVAAVLLMAEGAGIFWSYQNLQKEERRQLNLRRDLSSMRQVSPAPTEANAKKIEEEIASYESATHWEHKLRGGEFPDRLRAEALPQESTDAYFDLVGYAERLRALTKRQRVQVDTEEYFGFADYAKEGPEQDLIEKVFRQRYIMEQVLRMLLLSNPTSLILVERSGGADTDEWRDQARLSLAVENVVMAEYVRIQFTGETASLRLWLNRLSEHESNPIQLPVSVRSVEVQPVRDNERRSSSRLRTRYLVLTSELPLTVPLVERSASEFTVVLEILEVMASSEEEDQ